MSPVVGILLTLIGYFIVRAGWRLYRAIEVDRPNKIKRRPRRQTIQDEFDEEYGTEDVHWRDLP